MRILALDTSSRRGSVAVFDAGALVARAYHTELSAHAERLAPLVDQVLSEAGIAKATVERVAVGMGPGSFTGLRVGIAFARGIALGLRIPSVGVGSLAAMARAAPPGSNPERVAVLDARRGEVFAQAFLDHEPVGPPDVLAQEEAREALLGRFPGALFLGEMAEALGLPAHRSELTDLPDAFGVGLLSASLDPSAWVRAPIYVRDAGATPQHLQTLDLPDDPSLPRP